LESIQAYDSEAFWKNYGLH